MNKSIEKEISNFYKNHSNMINDSKKDVSISNMMFATASALRKAYVIDHKNNLKKFH